MSTLVKYSDAVLATYEMKKLANQLSINLVIATPAKLKKECLIVCNNRYSEKDKEVLLNFFENGEDKDSFTRVIRKFDNDKLKPLQDFIQGGTKTPDRKNVELLAWLIDFQPRPEQYNYRYKIPSSDQEAREIEEIPISTDEIIEEPGNIATTPQVPSGDEIYLTPEFINNSPITTPPKKLKKYGSLIVGVIVFIAFIIYWNGREKDISGLMGIGLPVFGACMYWTGDQYLQISCSEKKGDTMVIALDNEKVTSFRRITQPDTITRKSIGNTWYVKINGENEYYTSDGFHPVYQQLRLKPITLYIIRKYIMKED